MSQFLQFAPASKYVTVNLKPGYAHLHASRFLHPDSKVAPFMFVPRNCTSGFDQVTAPGSNTDHQLVYTANAPQPNQFAPGRQKLRHAPLFSAVYRDSTYSLTNPPSFQVTASFRCATFTNSTAGPLCFIIRDQTLVLHLDNCNF